MGLNLIKAVRGLFSPQPGRRRSDAGKGAGPAMLSMTSWPGRKVRYQVQLIEKQQDEATVWCSEYVDVGQSVWIEEGEQTVECSVKAYLATGGGYRLKLCFNDKSRRSQERAPCNTPGDLEWMDGLTRVRCPVRITNLTQHGAQVTLARPTPEARSVRLQCNGQAAVGMTRYCVQIGASYLAGVEFV